MKLRFCEWLIKHGMRKLAHSLSPSLCCLIDTRKAMNRLAEENSVHLDVSKKDTL